MKLRKPAIKRRNGRKRKEILFGFSILEISILAVLIVGGSVAAYYRYEHSQKSPAKLTTATTKSSSSANQQLFTLKTNPINTPSTATSTSNKSCAQTEASQVQVLNSNLSQAWTTWSTSSGLTQAGVNYYYNQSAQYDYNLYVQLVQKAGCTPQVARPALKYPATAPSTASSPTYIAPVATCNTTQEATYTSQYDAAVQQENQRYETLLTQENSALAYMGIHGAGGSSAYQEVEAEIAQNNAQHTATLNSLSETYLADKTSIDCS